MDGIRMVYQQCSTTSTHSKHIMSLFESLLSHFNKYTARTYGSPEYIVYVPAVLLLAVGVLLCTCISSKCRDSNDGSGKGDTKYEISDDSDTIKELSLIGKVEKTNDSADAIKQYSDRKLYNLKHNIQSPSSATLAVRRSLFNDRNDPASHSSSSTSSSNRAMVSTLTVETGFTDQRYNSVDSNDGSSGSPMQDDDFLSESIVDMVEKDATALIGWQIAVKNRGRGVVIGVKKKMFAGKIFDIQFDDGHVSSLPLKRGTAKGSVQWKPICKK